MQEDEMFSIADLIARVLESPDDDTIARVGTEVRQLAEGFPLYAGAVPT